MKLPGSHPVPRCILYMHTKGIAHRDLKPENFLLKDKHGPTTLADNTLKLIDFGVAQFFDANSQKNCFRTVVGTAYYVAPEVMKSKSGYNEKCDIWSCGIILYILMCGYPPFPGEDDHEIMRYAAEGCIEFDGPEWEGTSAHVKNFILKMCCLDVKKRVSAKEALEDQWWHLDRTKLPQQTVEPAVNTTMFENLQKFTSSSRFKRAALHLIAHRLDDKSIKDLHAAFIEIDQNGDGMLTLGEVRAGCSEVGVNSEYESL
eukprot:gnl/TRDRNA2_/TRDRNA2_134725_c1_seq4.p1 gnl/TRDRNA2_/TRDRNA2_134725_c1~~gnl/TRDRNA2_/TRDRNA2_134725_c1_seq4.p1  ORF type:complete len:268 (-),score=40.69 gnl/TRDRNA2_/TRDRNA2_134725_c1_seq4:2-778(-)